MSSRQPAPVRPKWLGRKAVPSKPIVEVRQPLIVAIKPLPKMNEPVVSVPPIVVSPPRVIIESKVEEPKIEKIVPWIQENARATLVIIPLEEDVLTKQMQELADTIKIPEQSVNDASPIMQLLSVMPILEVKPKERLIRTPKKGKCCYISAIAHDSWSKRTVSWCMLLPNATSCNAKLTFCFNVDEVQQWIIDHEEEELEGLVKDVAKKPKQCPMFMHATLVRILKEENIKDIVIPEMMTEEFRTVIENFAIIDVGEKSTQEIDIFQRKVVEGITKYLESKLASTENTHSSWNIVGSFYHYTKQGMKKLMLKGAKLAIWFLENPWYLMMAVTVARVVRTVICIIMSFDEIAVESVLLLFDKIMDELRVRYGGLPERFVSILRNAVECATRFISWQSGSLIVCLQKITQEMKVNITPAADFGLQSFMAVYNYTMDFVLTKVDATNLATTMAIANTDPENVYIALTHADPIIAQKAATTATLKAVISQFRLTGDWEMTLLLFVLSKLPYDKLWNFTIMVCPPLKVFHKIYSKWNPLHIFAKLAQYKLAVSAVWAAILEIKMWIFDLGRCVWNVLVQKVMTYFGYADASTIAAAPMAVTCCMTDIVVMMQKYYMENSIIKTREKTEELNAYIIKKKQEQSIVTTVSNKVSDGLTYSVEAASNIAASVSSTIGSAMDMAGDGYAYGRKWMGWTETMKAFTDDNKLLLFTTLWVLGNTSQENQVCPHPFLTLDDGEKKVPFNIFITTHDNMYPNAPRVFIMIPIDFIKKHYPSAVFNYFNRDFVLLKYLPRHIAKHLLQCKAPVFHPEAMFQNFEIFP